MTSFFRDSVCATQQCTEMDALPRIPSSLSIKEDVQTRQFHLLWRSSGCNACLVDGMQHTEKCRGKSKNILHREDAEKETWAAAEKHTLQWLKIDLVE